MNNYNLITKIKGRQGKQDMNHHSKPCKPKSGIQQVTGQTRIAIKQHIQNFFQTNMKSKHSKVGDLVYAYVPHIVS